MYLFVVLQYNQGKAVQLAGAIADQVRHKLIELGCVSLGDTGARGFLPANAAGHRAEVESPSADIAHRRQALEAQQRRLGPDHPDTLASMNDLSKRLAEVGQHEEAANMARQALEARQRVLGPDHPDTLGSTIELSSRLGELGQHQLAADLSWQAMKVRQRVLGPEHPDTLASLDTLSNQLAALGQHKAAEAMARQAQRVRHRVLGPEHLDTLASMDTLSIRLAALGQRQAAEAMAHQAKEARQRISNQGSEQQQRDRAAHRPLLPDTPSFADHLGELRSEVHSQQPAQAVPSL